MGEAILAGTLVVGALLFWGSAITTDLVIIRDILNNDRPARD